MSCLETEDQTLNFSTFLCSESGHNYLYKIPLIFSVSQSLAHNILYPRMDTSKMRQYLPFNSRQKMSPIYLLIVMIVFTQSVLFPFFFFFFKVRPTQYTMKISLIKLLYRKSLTQIESYGLQTYHITKTFPLHKMFRINELLQDVNVIDKGIYCCKNTTIACF